VYTHHPDVVTFVSRGRVTVSHFYLADDPLRAGQVDATSRVAYLALADVRMPEGWVESLEAAGIAFERETTPLGPLFTGFRLAPVSYREIAPAAWSATAAPRPELAGHAIDRDVATRWRTVGRPANAWLQVDLGDVHPVGMVSWLPGGYQEVPLGFRLETSVDGAQWTVGREVQVYYGPLYWAGGHPMGRVRWGRVEARFPPRPARYVRVTHLGRDDRHPWTVRELFVYAAAVADKAEPAVDARPAADALLAMGARRLYADHGEGPRIVAAAGGALRALPDNVQVDRFGQTPSLERLPFLLPATDAAIAYPADTPTGPSIEATLLAAGVTFTATDAGGYRLLGRLEGARLPGRVAWPRVARVHGAMPGGDPRAAVDGRVETRWSTGAPQAPGQWLAVELEAPVDVAGLELDTSGATLEYPRGVAVQVVRDRGWEDVTATVRWLGPLVWVGTHVLRAGVERVVVTFPAERVRGVRVAQTGRDTLHPWSVAELRLLSP
jgi:hypothetical protein